MSKTTATDSQAATELATLGGGCFWCLEAVFQQVQGVISVTSGYAGGQVANPTYQEVCTGTTGHAEVIQIRYDPHVVTYEQLLDLFWAAHDPTTLNRQGHDVGTQYRSVIYTHGADQRVVAEQSKQRMAESGRYAGPIVTEIAPLVVFYAAEAYHQNYYRGHADAPYCQAVIVPKLIKLNLAQ